MQGRIGSQHVLAFVCLILGVTSSWSLNSAVADTDVGNIAIVEADATILPESFDLDRMTLEFTPNVGGGYNVTAIPFTFESNTGANLGLKDNDAVQLSLGFIFRFFGVPWPTVFISANGFVNFKELSFSIDESFEAFVCGVPSIAVLSNDFNPSVIGRVLFNGLGNRAVVTWQGVPKVGTANANTFQVVLFNNGTIRMSYNGVAVKDGLVGIAKGNIDPTKCNTALGSSIDFTAGPIIGRDELSSLFIAQLFVDPANTIFIPTIPLQAITRKFYQTHADTFDQLVIITNFAQRLVGAAAVERTVHLSVDGIGSPPFDISAVYGSTGRLSSVVNMNSLASYPADPRSSATLSTLGEEVGHLWLTYALFLDDKEMPREDLLGRGGAHWSFFVDTNASFMDGNNWVDRGDGRFTSYETDARYSALDQYFMGLRTPAEVAGFFFIANPVPASSCNSLNGKTCPPAVGVTVTGTRQNVSIRQIIAAVGPRNPASGFTAENRTNVLRQAFILLTRPGALPIADDIRKWEGIRAAWIPYFAAATDNRGTVDTDLGTRNQNRPPNGTIDTPPANVTITQGQSVNFAGTGTDPEGDLPLAFMWNFGGGDPSSTQKDPGAVPFNTAGTFTVTFTVTDRLGIVDPTPDIRIITVNTRPSDDGGGSGGGCTISSGAVFDPILVGLVGLAAVLVSKSTVAYYIRYFRYL